MDEWEELKKKHGGGAVVAPTPKLSGKVTGDGDYDSLLLKYADRAKSDKIASIQKETEDLLNKPTSIKETIIGTAKELPGAVLEVGKTAIKDPLQTGRSIVGGFLDVGPAILNSLASMVGIKGRLPLPGQTFNEYIGNDSDVQNAIRESSKTIGGYELGGGLSKKIISGGAIQRILGNVIGGQLITEAETAQERVMQATFDAAFGAAIEAGGAIIKGVAGKIKGKPTPEVKPPEIAKLGEKPGIPEAKPEVPAQKPPEIKYIPKKSLGVDQAGEKILARTQVDAKTGNAIVYYTKALERKPDLKAEVLDHEIGHIVDKRLNKGTNLSAELINPEANKVNLSAVFDDFAKKQNKQIEQVLQDLNDDLNILGGRARGKPAEMFAEAVREYRRNPEGAKSIAPTFVDFMDYSPVGKEIPRFSERSTTMGTMKAPPEGTTLKDLGKPEKPAKPIKTTTETGFEKGADSFDTSSAEAIVKDLKDTVKEYRQKVSKKVNSNIAVEEIQFKDLIRTKLTPDKRLAKLKKLGSTDFVTVVKEGNRYRPIDGQHRIALAEQQGNKSLKMIVAGGNKNQTTDQIRKAFQSTQKLPKNDIFYHGTTKADAKSIIKKGFDPKLSKKGANTESPYALFASKEKGGGSDHFAGTYGDTVVEIRPKGKIKTGGEKVWAESFGKSKGAKDSAKIADDLRKQGYDIIVQDNGEAIILNPKKFSFSEAKSMQPEAKPMQKGKEVVQKPSEQVYYHGTNNADTIEKKGFSTSKKAQDGSNFLGDNIAEGVHISKSKEPYAEGGQLEDVADVLEVKVNAKNILKTEFKDISKLYEKYGINELGDKASVKFTKALQKDGYDGIEYADEIVIFNHKDVKAVKRADLATPPEVSPETSPFAGTGLKTDRPGVEAPSFNPKSINAPQEVDDLMRQLGAEQGEFKSQRISKGNEDIKDLARLTGLTENQLIKAQPGSIANAETITAARQLVLDKANDLMNKLKGVDLDTAGASQLREVKDEFVKLIAMQKSVAGLRTEASNVFRSLGIELLPGENATLKEIGSMLKNLDGFAEADAELFSKSVGKQITLTRLQHAGQGFLSTWYSAILSGPATTLRNVTSTGSNVLTELAAKISNPSQWNEVVPTVNGMLRGVKTGWTEAKAVLQGEHSVGKFAETGKEQLHPDVFTGKWVTYGKVVESVGRFLNAQDRFFSAIAREGESASLKARAPEINGALSDAISKAYAESTAYHGIPKGRVIQGLRESAQALRRKIPESKIIVPFVDTVANVLDRQFDYLPITSQLRLRRSVLENQADVIIKNFDLPKTDKAFIVQRLRDQQVGRMFLGTLVSIGAFGLAANGKVSGSGPTNIDEKNQLMRTGWRPNSIQVGETWVPYTYLGPLSGVLFMAGNIYDKTTYDQADNKTVYDLMKKGMVGWTKSQLDQSFLSGVSDLFDVVTGNTDPDKYFKRLLTGVVPIPAAYSQTKDMIFQQQYETHDIVQQLRQKLGLTGDAFGANPLQPRLDAFGEPMTKDLIYGLTPVKENIDKVDEFLISSEIVVTKPQFNRQYSIPGTKDKRKLTEEEYTKYIQQSGKEIYETIANNLGELENRSQEERKKSVDRIVDRARERARRDLLQ